MLSVQHAVGNAGTVALLAAERPAERGVRQVVQRSPEWSLGETLLALLPPQLAGRVRALGATAALAALVAGGYRDENKLTNIVFWARHPELTGQPIAPEQHELAREWVSIRDTVVRPALRGTTPDTPEPRPDPSGPALTTDDTPGGNSGPIPSSQLGPFGSDEATAFRRRVYDAQLQRNMQSNKEFFPGLPPGQLDETPVDGSRKMHKDAAPDCRALLQAARAELAERKAAGDAHARRVSRIGVRSAYRDPVNDLAAWKDAFATHYGLTADRRASAAGGPHGAAALEILVNVMVVKKAVPGFSNHTRGLAVDFTTGEGGNTLGPSSSDIPAWKRSWLFAWLHARAGDFHFHPYWKEPWHWDHG